MPSIGNSGMKFDVRFNGLEDIRAKMLALKKTIALQIMKDGIKAGAEVVRDKARRNLDASHSVRTGALIQSVIVRSGRANAPARVSGYEEWAGVVIAPTVFEARFDEGKLVVLSRKGHAPSGSIKPRSYAHLVEFGVQPHAVGKGSDLEETIPLWKRDKKGRLRKVRAKTGGTGKQIGAPHPGFPARPFMRPAFDAGKFEAHQVVIATVRRRLEEEIRPWEKKAAGRAA